MVSSAVRPLAGGVGVFPTPMMLGPVPVVQLWDWAAKKYSEMKKLVYPDEIRLPPSYTTPPAPTQPEEWRQWTPDVMYESIRQRRGQYLRDVAEPPVRQSEEPSLFFGGGGGGEEAGCSWYEHRDEESGGCAFGSTMLWVLCGAGVMLVMMAAAAGAGARTAGRVIEKRYLG